MTKHVNSQTEVKVSLTSQPHGVRSSTPNSTWNLCELEATRTLVRVDLEFSPWQMFGLYLMLVANFSSTHHMPKWCASWSWVQLLHREYFNTTWHFVGCRQGGRFLCRRTDEESSAVPGLRCVVLLIRQIRTLLVSQWASKLLNCGIKQRKLTSVHHYKL